MKNVCGLYEKLLQSQEFFKNYFCKNPIYASPIASAASSGFGISLSQKNIFIAV
jgi:hypothetical protein